MKKLILCEGVTDAILLSYYLEKVAGWTYCKAPKDLPIKKDRENESVNWYKKDNDFLLICGVGGKDNFSHFFNSKIQSPLFLTNAFERIAVVTDRDQRQINEIEQEMKESFIDDLNVCNNQWCESHYMDAFGLENKIDFLLVVIPNDCQGALETIMLEAISENPYDKNIVDKVNIFLKQIRDEASKYISSNRLELKAHLGVTWAIQYPEKIFSLIDQQIKSVNWEKSKMINTCFAELKNI